MTMSDPIADMLTRIRNANTAKHDTVDVPSSKMKLAIADILVKEGFIKKYDVVEDGNFKTIRITLKYGKDKNEKIISGIKRISKPGLRIYANKEDMPKVLGGLGVAIISTNLKFTSFFVSDHTFVCGKDCDSKSAKYSRELIFTSVDTKTWFGDSLKSCDDLVILCLTVFQCDMDGFEYAIFDQIVFFNVSFIYKDVCDCDFHFGCRNIYCIMFCSVSVTDSCKHICNRIAHCHDSFLLII